MILKSTGISLSFEAPFADSRRAILRSVRQAHALGLRVLIVPHLWVESGEWRGELDPGSDAGWEEWSRNYRAFLLTWAEVARESRADMLAVGGRAPQLAHHRARAFLSADFAGRATRVSGPAHVCRQLGRHRADGDLG